jgi:hypothetical protein
MASDSGLILRSTFSIRFDCGYNHLVAVFRQADGGVDQLSERDQQRISNRQFFFLMVELFP